MIKDESTLNEEFGIQVFKDIYWEDKDEQHIIGLHGNDMESWINGYTPDGKFVGSFARVFDRALLITELNREFEAGHIKHLPDFDEKVKLAADKKQ